MNEWLEMIPILLAAGAGGYMIYAIARRGFKGAMFGYAIKETCSEEAVYRRQGARHTLRLHQLEPDNLYGLEASIWTGLLGGVTTIVIPREELLKLARMVDQFVETSSESGD